MARPKGKQTRKGKGYRIQKTSHKYKTRELETNEMLKPLFLTMEFIKNHREKGTGF